MLYGIIWCYILLYGVYMVLYSIIYSVIIHFSHFRPFLHYPYPIYIYRIMLYKKPLNFRKLCKPNAWSRFCHVSIVNIIFFLSLRALWYFHIYLRYLPLFDLTIINTHHIQIYFQNPRSTIQNLHFFINFISVFQDPPFQNLHFPLTSYLFQVLPKIHFHELHFGFKIHHFKTSI